MHLEYLAMSFGTQEKCIPDDKPEPGNFSNLNTTLEDDF